MPDFDITYTSRARLLASAKKLFARKGYEQTSTSSIAREAGTSESQLVRYFGGKAGLLEAIFNESWTQLHETIQSKAVAAPTARAALLTILSVLIASFRQDHDLAHIFLFEGRRIRGVEHEVFISEGFVRFSELLRQIVMRGREDGSFSKNLHSGALVSAVVGAAEGMIRDRLAAERLGKEDPYSEEDVRQVMEAMLEAL